MGAKNKLIIVSDGVKSATTVKEFLGGNSLIAIR